MNRKLAVVLAGLAAVAALLGGLATAGARDHDNGAGIFGEIHVSIQCEGPSPVEGTAADVVITFFPGNGTVGEPLTCDQDERFASYVGMLPGPGPGTFSWSVTLSVTDGTVEETGMFSGVGSGFARLACETCVDNIAVNFEIAGSSLGPAAPCIPVCRSR